MEESHQKQENNLPQDLTSDRLDSWKEIAAYLDRDVRTVVRWEKRESLPVRRHVHNKQATVYASRSEIDTWLKNRGTSLAARGESRG